MTLGNQLFTAVDDKDYELVDALLLEHKYLVNYYHDAYNGEEGDSHIHTVLMHAANTADSGIFRATRSTRQF